MYQLLKSLLSKLIPEKQLLKNELFFRKIYALPFTGNKYQCPVCNKKLRKFVPIFINDFLCPCCGSLSRNRRLFSILEEEYLKNSLRVLDFSPSRCLYRKFKSNKSIQYTANDFCGEFFADKNMDITNLEEPDDSYDLVICYHILEHIQEDVKAMSELYRILKPEGTVIIQTPFKEGDLYEDEKVITDKDRKLHFGQEDHVRIYSVKGLCQRLESTGFNVKAVNYKEKPKNYYGFSANETIIFCRK